MTRFKILLAGAVLALSSTTVLAQDFTTGKTITIISGGTGGYDAYARLLGRHMNRFLPGEPNVIVKNMPAAASMAAANVIYNATAPDGLTFGSFLRQIPFAPLLGDASAKYDAQKFTWIGTSSHFLDDVSLFFVRKDLGIRSVEELRARRQPLNFGSAGRTSTGDESARLIGPVLGLDLKIIRG